MPEIERNDRIKRVDIEKLRNAIKEGSFEWRKHTLIRLAQLGISQDIVLKVILEGEVIKDYPEDKPFPSSLIFKMIESEPYHVVVSFDIESRKAYIITVYEPTLDKFEPDFKTRRK